MFPLTRRLFSSNSFNCTCGTILELLRRKGPSPKHATAVTVESVIVDSVVSCCEPVTVIVLLLQVLLQAVLAMALGSVCLGISTHSCGGFGNSDSSRCADSASCSCVFSCWLYKRVWVFNLPLAFASTRFSASCLRRNLASLAFFCHSAFRCDSIFFAAFLLFGSSCFSKSP